MREPVSHDAGQRAPGVRGERPHLRGHSAACVLACAREERGRVGERTILRVSACVRYAETRQLCERERKAVATPAEDESGLQVHACVAAAKGRTPLNHL